MLGPDGLAGFLAETIVQFALIHAESRPQAHQCRAQQPAQECGEQDPAYLTEQGREHRRLPGAGRLELKAAWRHQAHFFFLFRGIHAAVRFAQQLVGIVAVFREQGVSDTEPQCLGAAYFTAGFRGDGPADVGLSVAPGPVFSPGSTSTNSSPPMRAT